MKAYAIVIKGNEISETGYANLVKSSERVKNPFTIERFDAITPDQVDEELRQLDIKWNYPWEGELIDFASGLTKSAYKTANPKARIACALSHYGLWTICSCKSEPFMILEHDAYFINQIDFNIDKIKYDILGLNNPLGTTRKSRVFYDKIHEDTRAYQPVPWIDDLKIPQGLAGNSAYIIKPKAAQELIKLVDMLGLWPNDAIMCRQLVPNMGVSKKHYTHIQHLKSTTTL